VLGAAGPRRQLDVLAVEQVQPHLRIQGGGGRPERLGDALAGAGLAAVEDVALDQRERDQLAVLVQADRDRLPQRQPLGAQVRPRPPFAGAQRVADHHHDLGQAGVLGAAVHADLADAQERGDRLGLVLDLGDGLAGRHPYCQVVAGQGEAVADDPGHPVVEVGQAGMADGQGPLATHMRSPVQQPDRTAALRYQRQRQGHDAGQEHGRGDAEVAGQPSQDRDGQQDGGQLDPPGPQRTADQQQQPGRRGHLDRRAQGGRGGVDDRGQPDPAQEVPHRPTPPWPDAGRP
jgi:hypothetical protein